MSEPATGQEPAEILKLSEICTGRAAALDANLDAIFYESSGTKTFADEATRRAFRERWLGRYMRLNPEWFYVAVAHDGAAIGYLAGCLEDPALTPRFADIGYFHLLGDLTQRFPAHLHINLAAPARSHGIGGRLIARFAHDAAVAGAPGVHVVTGKGMRNVGFYTRNGFHEARVFAWNGKELVFLARDLAA